MTVCGTCGHEKRCHRLERGACHETIRYGGGQLHRCTCEEYRSLGALIGVRILGVLTAVCVVGSLPALVEAVAR